MTVEALLSRIKDLSLALEQSAANHHGLLGRLAEAKEVLDKLQSGVLVAEEAVKTVEDVSDPKPFDSQSL
jgi:hypothetical protein